MLKTYHYTALDHNLNQNDPFYTYSGSFSIKEEIDVKVVIDNMAKLGHEVINIKEFQIWG